MSLAGPTLILHGTPTNQRPGRAILFQDSGGHGLETAGLCGCIYTPHPRAIENLLLSPTNLHCDRLEARHLWTLHLSAYPTLPISLFALGEVVPEDSIHIVYHVRVTNDALYPDFAQPVCFGRDDGEA